MRIVDGLQLIAATASIVSFLATPLTASGADIDWKRITRLQDQAFLDYVKTLDLHGQQAIDFWKKVPLSRANRQINRIFRKEAFGI